MKANRKARLKKIHDAQRELESCLPTLKNNYSVKWTDAGFGSLYYLLRLAKKAK